MFDEMHDIASQLVVKWARFGSKETIDVSADFTRLTLDSIALWVPSPSCMTLLTMLQMCYGHAIQQLPPRRDAPLCRFHGGTITRIGGKSKEACNCQLLHARRAAKVRCGYRFAEEGC